MIARLVGIITILMLTASLFAGGKTSGQTGTAANRLIVKLKDSDIRAFRKEAPLQLIMKTTGAIKAEALLEKSNPIADEIGLSRVHILHYSTPAEAIKAAKQLSRRSDIEYAEPDRYFSVDRSDVQGEGQKSSSLQAVPNDELLGSIHPLGQVKAFDAWDIQKGDSSVVVAVVDTGVDWDHEDLVSAIYINQGEFGPDGNGGEKQSNGVDDDGNGFIDDFRGWDFVDGGTGVAPGEDGTVPDNNPMDFNGHGTHVAGISAGMTNNGIGIASLSWGVKVLPCRIGYHTTDGNGVGNSLNMGRAFMYAADMGADVINLSFGNSGQFITDASLYAVRKGTLVVSSAGNSDNELASEMELKPWVLTVAAVNRNDLKTYYSTYGTWVKISAPGGEQFSASSSDGFLSSVVYPSSIYGGKKYEYFQGTSMASPFVASLAALLRSQNPEISVIDLFERIRQTADDIYSLNPLYAGKLGSGRINALRALTETGLTPAKPSLILQSASVNDGSGNNNGVLNLGEAAMLEFAFQNEWGSASDLTFTLSAEGDSWPVTITTNTANSGPVASVLDSVNSAFSVEFPVEVDAAGIPRVMNYELTVTGENGFEQTFSGRLAVEPSALLVADFDPEVDYTANYLELMDQASLSYDVWNGAVDEITAEILGNYPMVFWPMGWSFPSLTEANMDAISGYLESGGRIYVSGQDVGWDMADPTGNTYDETGGNSKTWYEANFHVVYEGDDNNQTLITGIDGDPISDGVESSIEMPGLAASSQYPDYVSLKNGSVAFLQYDNGDIAGTRYEGDAGERLIYLPFGGLEAVSDPVSADLLTSRISNWLYGYQIEEFIPLKNTENTSDSRPVSVSLSGDKTISSVYLYYQSFPIDADPAFDLTRVAMDKSDNSYSSSIPAVELGNTVIYFFIAEFEDGTLSPFKIHHYDVKTDVTAPVVLGSSEWPNTMDRNGIYHVDFYVGDESGINESSVKVHYQTSNGFSDSTVLSLTDINRGSYSGNMSIPGPINANTMISYHFTARDQSLAGNLVRYPESGDFAFLIGRAHVDDMEAEGYWLFDGKFGYTTKRRLSGAQAIHNNQGNNYTSNDVSTATYSGSFDFTGYANPAFRIQAAYRFGSGDTCYAEINTGDGWTVKHKFFGNAASNWTAFVPAVIFAPEATGIPTTQLRFRFVSDGVSSGTNSGIYFDDLEVLGDTVNAVSVSESGLNLPTVINLDQNYPNPFNPSTQIRYAVPVNGLVRLVVFDALGREVSVLVDEKQPAGNYLASFNGNGLSSGVYFYKLTVNGNSLTRKMLLMK